MIEIFTCLTAGSEKYAEHLHANLVATAWPALVPVRLRCIADESAAEDVNTKRLLVRERVQRPYPPNTGHNGANHAAMLARIVHHIARDTRIVVVADADTALLQHAWNARLEHLLKRYAAVFTPKFSGPPGPYFSAFRADAYREVVPDWRPGTEANGWRTETDQMDTGHRLAQQFAHLPTLSLEVEVSAKLGYLYTMGGHPFLCHMGASHKKPWGGAKARNWVARVRRRVRNNPTEACLDP